MHARCYWLPVQQCEAGSTVPLLGKPAPAAGAALQSCYHPHRGECSVGIDYLLFSLLIFPAFMYSPRTDLRRV